MAIIFVSQDDQGWLSAVITGTISGVLFGAFTGWRAAREQARWRIAAGGDLSDVELGLVHRAVSKGPVPSDPRLRLAAVRAATYSLAKHDNDKEAGVVFLLVFPVLILLQVLDSLWWLVAVPVYIYAGYGIWAEPRRLRARVELLSRPEQQPI